MMEMEGMTCKAQWEKAGIVLPSYNVRGVTEKAIRAPRWVHFGIGNIFRIFIGGIADDLIERGLLDRGLTCVETFDYEIVDKIYRPFDNLGLSVILNGDGTRDVRVIASLAEAVKADCHDAVQWNRLKEVFSSPDLQIVSFTITEKGYALKVRWHLFSIHSERHRKRSGKGNQCGRDCDLYALHPLPERKETACARLDGQLLPEWKETERCRPHDGR